MLGVERGATPDEIKVAWRGLARQHHPDLTGDDPELSQRATRQMAEINAAYAALTRGPKAQRRPRATRAGAPGPSTRRGREDGAADGAGAAAPGSTAARQPTRPVTGRLDTADTVRPRNQTITPGTPHPLPGQPPLRHGRSVPDLRASQPTGPIERGWRDGHVAAGAGRSTTRSVFEVDFGKFHGHTLGEIAAFEPSYIDWLAGTQTRDPERRAGGAGHRRASWTGGGSCGVHRAGASRAGTRTRTAEGAQLVTLPPGIRPGVHG